MSLTQVFTFCLDGQGAVLPFVLFIKTIKTILQNTALNTDSSLSFIMLKLHLKSHKTRKACTVRKTI